MQELGELKEREALEVEGFSEWNRSEYIKFIKACEKFGREQLQQITDEVGTKNVEEVRTYANAFWSRGLSCIGDFEKIVKRVEEGERKILEKAKMAEVSATQLTFKPVRLRLGLGLELGCWRWHQVGGRHVVPTASDSDCPTRQALKSKVTSTENPWQTLQIKYGNNRGKLFTEDEVVAPRPLLRCYHMRCSAYAMFIYPSEKNFVVCCLLCAQLCVRYLIRQEWQRQEWQR